MTITECSDATAPPLARGSGLQRALVVDDHACTRIGFKVALQDVAGIIALEAASLSEALMQIKMYPDIGIIISDLALPDSDGLKTVEGLRKATHSARLAITSCDLPPELMLDCFRLGARWFIDKALPPAMIAPILESLLEGESFVPGSMIQAAADARAAYPSRPSSSATGASSPSRDEEAVAALSGRPADIAALLAKGLSNKHIANRLGLSPGTVKNYVARILEALETQNRAQAAIKLATYLPISDDAVQHPRQSRLETARQ